MLYQYFSNIETSVEAQHLPKNLQENSVVVIMILLVDIEQARSVCLTVEVEPTQMMTKVIMDQIHHHPFPKVFDDQV